MNRVPLLLVVPACLFAVQPSWASQPDFHLQVVPAIVYKVDDPGNTKTSSFVFDIAVICSTECALTPISASVELSNGRSTVERQEWTTELVAKIKGVNYRILPDTPVASPRRMFTLPEAFDLHFYLRCPQALAIDSADIRVTVADAKGRRAQRVLRIPIRYYQQKTLLILPFRGKGVVGQDWVTNGGHGGGHGGVYGSDFAVDLRGLDDNYAEQKNDADENASAAGWGREILAPAAGTVTYARNDVPDNPHPGNAPDINWYTALHDPVMAYYGNCVIIDHGNSEYSVLAHMQQGSVRVKVGERVAAGQVLGRLGNSGDAFGPHLHYQLQSGQQLFHDQGLPFRFQNIDVPQLSRGREFEAK
ncbi:M23 family metallopeptidase [Edaphobacter aggregans]|uniref:M23 family metallopeptidase n=1 Tax=Edaphobacter aggregans TaxID=570835 RepID=UPI0014704D5E|nr:M23 family metallopeptidase [Edaphobacter aggregans]